MNNCYQIIKNNLSSTNKRRPVKRYDLLKGKAYNKMSLSKEDKMIISYLNEYQKNKTS